jgi:hypothetical protein
MKLTAQQISKIEETLVLNGIQYEDIKLELTDHIASEIEEKITLQGYSFEVALHDVFQNWKEQLRPATSFWINSNKAFPRIILDKWISESKKQLLKGTLLIVILTVLFSFVARLINNWSFFGIFRMVLKAVFILEFIFIGVSKILIWRSSQSTSSGFIFQNQTKIAALFLLLILGLGVFPLQFVYPDFKIGLGNNFLFICYLVWPIKQMQLAFKHFQFVKKLKLT